MAISIATISVCQPGAKRLIAAIRRPVLSKRFIGRIKYPSTAIAIRMVAEIPSKTEKAM
jgi:hypothetical protein